MPSRDLPRRGPRALVALLLGGALIAVGCGSSSATRSAASATSTTTSTAPAKESVSEELRAFPHVASAAGTAPLPSSTGATVDRAFLHAVFKDAQRMWRNEFGAAHLSYSPARLVIFTSNVRSPCGFHEDAGPFYCPGDHGIYADLSWFEALARLHGVGAFAQAYIIGHEFGHHVQRLLTIDTGAAGQRFPSKRNALSVAGELQADCLAGVWADSAYGRSRLSTAALNDMLRKADVIGDDFAARNEGKTVDPGLFTHGSSAQRQRWLRTGFESGDPNMCDTFAGR